MKKLFSYLVIAAVAVALGLLPGSAQAGTLTNGGTAGATYANEIFGPGSDATTVPSAEDATAVYSMASAPGSGAAFMITFTLNQGATWSTALVSGDLAFADVDSSSSAVTIALTDGGGVDDSTSEFRVDVTTAITGDDTFTLTYGIDDADPLATAAAAINLAITLTDGLGNVDSAENTDICDSADGTTETVAASAQAGTCYIDVATANVEFGGNSPDVISATEVILGSVSLTDGGAVEDDGATAWDAGVADAANTVTLTVTGVFSASLGVDTDSDSNTADGVYLDLDESGTYDAGEEADTLDATTATWNLGNTVEATLTTENVHMVVDGVTPIGEHTPSATLAVNWDTATYLDESTAGDFRQLAKNGTTRYVYNIPASDNSDQAYIRIYNTSLIDGTVRGSLYDQDGNVVGTANMVLVSDMAAGTTQVFSAADLETLFDGTWTGRARMTIDSETPSMEIQALIRSATGTITNMNRMAP